LGRLTNGFNETPNLVVIAHQVKIEGPIRLQLKNQTGFQSRSAFVEVACQFSDTDAHVQMRISPGSTCVVYRRADNKALSRLEIADLLSAK
jgi:hypothetical protein